MRFSFVHLFVCVAVLSTTAGAMRISLTDIDREEGSSRFTAAAEIYDEEGALQRTISGVSGNICVVDNDSEHAQETWLHADIATGDTSTEVVFQRYGDTVPYVDRGKRIIAVGDAEDVSEGSYRTLRAQQVWLRPDGHGELFEDRGEARVLGELHRDEAEWKGTLTLGRTALTSDSVGEIGESAGPVGAFEFDADGKIHLKLYITSEVHKWGGVLIYAVEEMKVCEKLPTLDIVWKGCTDSTGIQEDPRICNWADETGLPRESFVPVIHMGALSKGDWSEREAEENGKSLVWTKSYDPRAWPPVMPEGCVPLIINGEV